MAPVPLYASLVLGGLPIVEFGSEEQQQRYLPALASGSAKFSAANRRDRTERLRKIARRCRSGISGRIGFTGTERNQCGQQYACFDAK